MVLSLSVSSREMPPPPSYDRTRIPAAPLPADHPDALVIQALTDEIEKLAGGWQRFLEEVPRRLRLALDEVIDTPRTGRFVLSDLEKTEKTYIGTKVEILVRDFLGIPKGLLDLEINGVDVDVKNTVTGGWMIPTEAVGKPCILLSENEVKARCGFGLIVCNPSYLTGGANKDGKVSISAAGRAHIHWILKDHPYPANFWEAVPDIVRRSIVEPKGGTQRLYRLFKCFVGKPISRQTAEAIARQKDFMKRLRGNGGVRDMLEPEGVVLLSGTYDRNLAAEFGIINLADDEFVACPVKTKTQLVAVRSTGRHKGVMTLAV
jgi:hypothetical protein